MKINEKQKNSILIVFGIFVTLVGLPVYMQTNTLENLVVGIIPGLIIIGIGLYKMLA